VLRLPWEVNPLFQQWLQQHVPERADRIMARLREMRGGRDNDHRFGSRMAGQGVWARCCASASQGLVRLGYRQRVELDLTLSTRWQPGQGHRPKPACLATVPDARRRPT
jgi:hypothetical protein